MDRVPARELLEVLRDPAAVFDRSGHYLYVNKPCVLLLGGKREQVEGRTYLEVVPDSVTRPFHGAFQRVAAGGAGERFEQYVPRFQRWYDVSLTGVGEKLVCIWNDVTDRKEAEEARAEVVANERAAHAERATAMRQAALLGAVAEADLRAPLSELAHSDAATADVRGRARRMERVARQLVQLARLAASPTGPKRVGANLGDVCAEVAGELHGLAPGATVRVDVTGDPSGEWDAAALREGILQLAADGVLLGSDRGDLRLSVDGRDADAVRVEVRGPSSLTMAGAGILLDPLGARRDGPVPLGVWIAQQIALAHGGSVTAEAHDGSAAFWLRLPRRA